MVRRPGSTAPPGRAARERINPGKALVRAVPVEVGEVLAQHAGQLPLAQDEDVIEALAAHAPQEALAHRVRARSAEGRAQHHDAAGRGNTREVGPELAVIVADEVLRASPRHDLSV